MPTYKICSRNDTIGCGLWLTANTLEDAHLKYKMMVLKLPDNINWIEKISN